MQLLGEGAFGSVFKARDTELDRILREARAVAQLRFPSIISIHEVGINEGRPYCRGKML